MDFLIQKIIGDRMGRVRQDETPPFVDTVYQTKDTGATGCAERSERRKNVREIVFCAIVAAQIFLVVFGKWGRFYGERLGLPIWFHVPYQVFHSVILFFLLNPWNLLAE